MSTYQENGEWELLEYGTKEQRRTQEEIKTDFSSLVFTFKMRRRPIYVFMSTILPTVLLSFLSALVFKLPPESGEKIGYSLTVLLSYAVYLTVISSHIPAASLTVSILSVYTVVVLVLGVIAVILAIIVLECYYKCPDEEVPTWFKKCAYGCLIPLSGWRPSGGRRGGEKNHKVSKMAVEPWDGKDNTDWDLKVSKIGVNEQDKKVSKVAKKEEIPEVPLTVWTDDILYWPELSKILDRCFFRIYICLLSIITGLITTLFTLGYYGYT